MNDIVDDLLESYDNTMFLTWKEKIKNANNIDIEYGTLLKKEINTQKYKRFFEIWDKLDIDSRYIILRKHLWENKFPSEGYIDLANLIKEGYFKTIITTNLDNLLEKALNSIGLYQPENFIVIVNGKDKLNEIQEQLTSYRKSIKIVKLHGTLESPNSYAFTPNKIFNFEKDIKENVSNLIKQSLIIIGHSMRNRDIDMLFEEDGKEIIFIKPTPPNYGSRIDTILNARKKGIIISGDNGRFDDFFNKLTYYINFKEKTKNNKDQFSFSISDFLCSIGYEHELEVPKSRYKNLQSLYVKPTEYKDILIKLEKEHVVFIIGEPHIGKTYTSFYLLWEYYQKGYKIIHIRHDRLITLFQQYDNDIKKILLFILNTEKNIPVIIHFDDPFGETMERRTNTFAKEINTFLHIIKKYEQLRIIVSSRFNVFRESLIEIHEKDQVIQFEKDLRVHTSYSRNILLEIFHKYILFYKPIWASNESIMEILDEKLPELLPAPHNIEFFVRTSERYTSLEEVLDHVENCKEMIKALGNWMASLPFHEQIFLIWLEVCSTSKILFANAPASNLDFENGYMEILAHFFKRKYIPGIPTNPCSHSKDKFEMILLENRVHESSAQYIDFVHPSYHEALWYAINMDPSMGKWWELLKNNIKDVLLGSDNRIDLVQLRMIERYGIINRDLDQLLLLSADSDDVNEQVLAFKHMLEKYEQFKTTPQLSRCYENIIVSGNQENKKMLMRIIEENIHKLPVKILNKISIFQFDPDVIIRTDFEEIFLRLSDEYVKRTKNNKYMKLRKSLENIIFSEEQPSGQYHLNLVDRIYSIDRQENSIKNNIAIKLFELNDNDFKLLFSYDLPLLLKFFIGLIQPNLKKLSKNKKIIYEKFTSSKKYKKILYNNIFTSRFQYKLFSNKDLINCLNYTDVRIKYEVLPGILLRYPDLSKKDKMKIDKIVNNPTDWWVGGSIGQMTKHSFRNVCDEVKQIPNKLLNVNNKKILGALLAEMTQLIYDPEMKFNEIYRPLFQQLCENQEIIKYAKQWMDYELTSFKFSDKDYWDNIKSHLNGK